MRFPSLVALAAMLLLGGCVSLFPKAEPAQLYRFGAAGAVPAQPAATPQSRFAVQALIIDFNRSATGDQILTMSGNEAAYIKGARWVSGASTLFEQALANAFDASQGPARLMARGEPVRPDYFLKLDVRVFEARYLQGRGSPPTIVVQVYAALTQPSDRALLGQRLFAASIPATDDRMGAIAAAFDQAVAQVLGQLIKWVDAKGAG
jgi:cholesterol transport system auxiliary component